MRVAVVNLDEIEREIEKEPQNATGAFLNFRKVMMSAILEYISDHTIMEMQMDEKNTNTENEEAPVCI